MRPKLVKESDEIIRQIIREVSDKYDMTYEEGKILYDIYFDTLRKFMTDFNLPRRIVFSTVGNFVPNKAGINRFIEEFYGENKYDFDVNWVRVLEDNYKLLSNGESDI